MEIIITQSDSIELFTRDVNWKQLSALVTKAIEIFVDLYINSNRLLLFHTLEQMAFKI